MASLLLFSFVHLLWLVLLQFGDTFVGVLISLLNSVEQVIPKSAQYDKGTQMAVDKSYKISVSNNDFWDAEELIRCFWLKNNVIFNALPFGVAKVNNFNSTHALCVSVGNF